MPGVVQELELLINQLSINRTVQQAEAAGAQIGKAIGEAPAVKDAARNLGATIENEIGKSVGRVKMDMMALATASGEIRQAVHPMTATMSAFAASTANVTTATSRATPGLNGMRSALTALASQALGIPGPLGRVASMLLQFSAGGIVTLGVVAGLGAIALAWNKITEATRQAREEANKHAKEAQQSNLAAVPERLQIADQIIEAKEAMATLRQEFAELEVRRGPLGAGLSTRQKEIIGLLGEEEQGVRRLIERLNQLKTAREIEDPARVEQRGLGMLGGWQGQAEDEGRERDRRQKERERERKAAAAELVKTQQEWNALVEEGTRLENEALKGAKDWGKEEQARVDALAEAEEQHQEDLAAKRAQLMGQLRTQLAGTTETAVDDLELELHNLQVEIIQTFGAVPAEVQPLLDDYRKRIEEARRETEKGKEPVKDLGTDWEKVGDTVANVAQGMLDLARGLGLVSDGMEKVLQGAISIGKNIGGALSGDPSSIIGVVGGVVSVVGGLFGGPDREPARRDENQMLYERAMKGDEAALNRLLMKSGPVSQGGWHSADARTDALNKYNSAKSHLAEQSTEYARQEAERAARGQEIIAQDLRDRQMGSEEAQVAQRAESERKTRITGLLAGGGPAELVNRLKQLEQEFEQIVKSSPFGEESPLARDSKRRADDAARDLERAVEDAKSEAERQAKEAERAQGKDITPGFTVQRTLTESSAGRIVGELTSQTIWLEKIYRQLGGREGVAGAAVGGPSVQVFIGGEQVEGVVSTQQAKSFQRHAALQGSSGMST